MTFEATRAIRADHRSLPGHFPDKPIVPGVLILDEVLSALVEWRGDCQLVAIPIAKFLLPLQPDQVFTICISANDDNASEVNFCCRSEERTIVEGRLELCWGDK